MHAFVRTISRLRAPGLLAAALICALPTAHAADVNKAAPVVKTLQGEVRGALSDGMREFKGIPYAQPPVGKLRWAMPQPAKAWNGVLDATHYGGMCPQLERYGIPESSTNEDCLYLNITVPEQASPQHKLPVMVWIHGGAFVGGSSGLYPLDTLARSGDMVVVSMNYRLGVFGFMASPVFNAAHNGGYGLEDQRLALRWVQHNIAAFGGDPHRVTIAGESAGGASVCMHLLAPDETKGLFQQAIVQSAGCATPLPTIKEAKDIGAKVAADVGCTDKDATKELQCMRSKSVQSLLEAGLKEQGANLVAFEPSIGTRTVPKQGLEALKTGRFVQVPVLMGGTRDELRLYVAYAKQDGVKVDAANYATLMEKAFGKHAKAILQQYPLHKYSSPYAAMGTTWSDFNPYIGLNNCIYLRAAELMSQRVPVFEFVFGDRDAPPVVADPGFEMGAVHSSELPYLFPRFDNTSKLAGPALKPASQALADDMLAYWGSFVRTGHPAAAGTPTWPRFKDPKTVMNLTPGRLGTFDAGAAHQCGFWKTQYPEILGR